MSTSAHYGSFTLDSELSPEEWVRSCLGEWADDFDVDGLTKAWVNAINELIAPAEIHGREIYGPYPPVDYDLAAAAELVDFTDLMERFDPFHAHASNNQPPKEV